MQIAFYPPFKPLDHPHPSGDQMIARELYAYLEASGHQLEVPSRLRCRWIYRKPAALIRALFEQQRICRRMQRHPPDLWITYHTYYKSPDILGPVVCRRCRIPYLIIQGSYATKVRRRLATLPGFLLNRRALMAADQHVTNRRRDLVNLERIIEPTRLATIRPGIHPDRFAFDHTARTVLRERWQVGNVPVIATAAMFRDDVKSEGIAWVIETSRRLHQQGVAHFLAIAGDGIQRERLVRLAASLPANRVLFTGLLPRDELAGFYSAADVFVFPGINESLGMVFLEAQSCGLPVVAFEEGGIPEVVVRDRTGLLTAPGDPDRFEHAVLRLLTDTDLRTTMGIAAADNIRNNHDVAVNYRELDHLLSRTVQRYHQETFR